MRVNPGFALLVLGGCTEYGLNRGAETPRPPASCELDVSPEAVPPAPDCAATAGFVPVVKWEGGAGLQAMALPAVADLDGDGAPEILVNMGSAPELRGGDLYVYRGTGGPPLWSKALGLGHASGPTVSDLDHDGRPEILVVRAYGSQIPMMGTPAYTVAALNPTGDLLWETERFGAADFDYGTGLVVSDMDHDGSPEVVAGRVILDARGRLRGRGAYGRGSYGIVPGTSFAEGTLPAVTDIDLDGVEEVLTGNAAYRVDGSALWSNPSAPDGMVAVANLDADPEGELVVSSHDTLRALNHDGTTLWGPIDLEGANIVSPTAIGDLDGDGSPEIVAAAGDALVAFRADGGELWRVPAEDASGATGPSLFDFDGDGRLEVMYFDEVQGIAVDGATGALRFHTTEHASGTMMDYPVIADVDGDGHAEVIVTHEGWTSAFSVYAERDARWAPARGLWTQHAWYGDNVADDLSAPRDVAPPFTTHNTWRAAAHPHGALPGAWAVEVEVLSACEDACEEGLFVAYRVHNASPDPLPAGLPVRVWVRGGGTERVLPDEASTPEAVDPGTTSPVWYAHLAVDTLAGVHAVGIAVDAGADGRLAECDEANNLAWVDGPFCGF